jgi:hypothetical protein
MCSRNRPQQPIPWLTTRHPVTVVIARCVRYAEHPLSTGALDSLFRMPLLQMVADAFRKAEAWTSGRRGVVGEAEENPGVNFCDCWLLQPVHRKLRYGTGVYVSHYTMSTGR